MLGISTSARLRARTCTAAVALALLAPSLAGCSGGSADPAEASSGDDASPSASESPDASVSPSAEATDPDEGEDVGASGKPPSAPKARNTVASRRDYAEFVVARWGFALATNDAKAMSSLSAKGATCQGCGDLRKELGKRKKQKWHVEFPGATVDKVTVKRDPAGPATFAAKARIDIPASRSYFEDGSYRNDNEAHNNAAFTVRMRFTKKRYVLLSYRVEL